jgi:hypothetical protein
LEKGYHDSGSRAKAVADYQYCHVEGTGKGTRAGVRTDQLSGVSVQRFDARMNTGQRLLQQIR